LNVRAKDKGTGTTEDTTIKRDKATLSFDEIEHMVAEADGHFEADQAALAEISVRELEAANGLVLATTTIRDAHDEL